jgi:hypothetical protein
MCFEDKWSEYSNENVRRKESGALDSQGAYTGKW